jgi:dihydrofolate synthase/folylpolyglutamate synthase
LPGLHQRDNLLVAVRLLEEAKRAGLPIDLRRVARAVLRTRWPGRLELVSDDPPIVLDGAHNPAGARALAAYVRRFHAGRRVWLVFGAMRDKAAAEMGGILAPVADRVILTAPAQARAVRPQILLELFDHPRARAAPDLAAALALAEEAAPGDVIFITGSLFLVGEARARLV